MPIADTGRSAHVQFFLSPGANFRCVLVLADQQQSERREVRVEIENEERAER